MQIIETPEDCVFLSDLTNQSLGFVPTMGHLHRGHLSLVERARQENDRVVVSIFVNPTQFNEADDYQQYPRTLAQDSALLEEYAVDWLFLPNSDSLYPDHYQYKVHETEISQRYEGQYRPGHFPGVLTVVLKLFNLIRPDRAYFGEKDFQQVALIQGMVSAFFLNVEICLCPTVRNEFGLPLSSRNSRLSEAQYQQARLFPKLFHDLSLTPHAVEQALIQQGFRVDYIVQDRERRYAAVWLDDVRLIDTFALAAADFA